MTTILSTDQAHDVRLDITVWESVWAGLYDRIEVWRSVLGEAGPYEELTAGEYLPARVPFALAGSGSGANVNIAGAKLRVRVGATELEFTIAGPDPRTFAQVAAQVTSEGLGIVRAFVGAGGEFVLETVAAGGAQCLEVLPSDAAALLGLPTTTPESIGYGHEPRIPLITGKESYSFRDYFGRKEYFYKVRFRNSLTGAVSAFSGPIWSMPKAGISEKNIVTGFVRLVRADGQPDVKQEVIVYTPSYGYQLEGKTVNGGKQVFLTDANGRVEVRLVRGMEIDVSIGGMNLMRRISVPMDPSVESFDMLDPEYGVDDTFAVKRPNIPYAEKRNL